MSTPSAVVIDFEWAFLALRFRRKAIPEDGCELSPGSSWDDERGGGGSWVGLGCADPAACGDEPKGDDDLSPKLDVELELMVYRVP